MRVDGYGELAAALRKFGKDYYRIREALGRRSIESIQVSCRNLKYEIERNPDHKHADVLPIMQTDASEFTQDEETRLLTALGEYGRDWRKVSEAVATRNYTSVKGHFHELIEQGKIKASEYPEV